MIGDLDVPWHRIYSGDEEAKPFRQLYREAAFAAAEVEGVRLRRQAEVPDDLIE